MWLIVVVPTPARLHVGEADGGLVLDVRVAQQELNASRVWQINARTPGPYSGWKERIVKVEDGNHIGGGYDRWLG